MYRNCALVCRRRRRRPVIVLQYNNYNDCCHCQFPVVVRCLYPYQSTVSCCSQQSIQVRRPYTSNSLHRPTILFQSNHLLVVNKPVGWRSVPNKEDEDTTNNNNNINNDDHKCLLQFLKKEQLGGGSKKDFLKPMHRIDQPCSGVLLFGKTTKAASRIQSAWQKVEKTYYVVVLQSSLERYMQSLDTMGNHQWDDGQWRNLSGYMQRGTNQKSTSSPQPIEANRGWNVVMFPDNLDNRKQYFTKSHEYRHCSLEWRFVWSQSSTTSHPCPQRATTTDTVILLEICTAQGARHMIRALLACYGITLLGDVRYSSSSHSNQRYALPDRSVALHAASLQLPSTLRSPPLPLQQQRFTAPLPKEWDTYFGITESCLSTSMSVVGGTSNNIQYKQQ